MEFFVSLIFFVYGAIFGSFYNVVIFRLPESKSIIKPRSSCPECGRFLGFFDLFPIFSYLFLKGKCRYCGTKISSRYAYVEFISAVLCCVCYLYFGFNASFFEAYIFCSLLLCITFIDLDHMIIPDTLSLGGSLVGALFAVIFFSWKDSLIGGFVGALVIYLIYLFGKLIYKKDAMGGGDLKMMLMVGIFLGLKGVLSTIAIGVFSGAVIGGILMILKIKGRKDYMPFGPFLAYGSLVSLFFADGLIEWYLGLYV